MRASPSGEAFWMSWFSGVGTNWGKRNCIWAASLFQWVQLNHFFLFFTYKPWNATWPLQEGVCMHNTTTFVNVSTYFIPSGQVLIVGEPMIEQILYISSASEEPGNNGRSVYSSANIPPAQRRFKVRLTRDYNLWVFKSFFFTNSPLIYGRVIIRRSEEHLWRTIPSNAFIYTVHICIIIMTLQRPKVLHCNTIELTHIQWRAALIESHVQDQSRQP